MPRKTFTLKITSDELTKNINPINIKLMNQFLREKSVRTSPKTILVYRSNLIIFLTWNMENNDNKSFIEIKKLEFSEFFSFASEEMKLGSARLNNLRSTLSSLSLFIEKFYDTDYPLFRNVILKVVDSSPKEVRREKTILSEEQIESLLQYLKIKDKQQACWLALAITSGARLSELLNFETDLIDESRTAFGDLFLETTKPIKTKGRGKSGKLLYKYILRDKFLPYYKEWLLERQIIMGRNGTNHNSIFIKANGTPAIVPTTTAWVKGMEDFLKVPVYAHALRHYLVTLLSRKNIPHPLIKVLFGWESVEMVGIYDDSTPGSRNYPELENLRI